MAPSQQVKEKRAIVNRNIRYGITLVIAMFLLGVYVLPLGTLQPLDTVGARLAYCLRWQFLSLLTVLYGVLGVGNIRGNSEAIDPINGKAEHLLKVEANFLQNTLEQFVLSFVGHLILSTYLSPTSTTVIPTLVILFVSARVVFWVVYHRHPMQRVIGFAMTLFPTLAVYAYVAYCILVAGPSHGL